MKKSVLTLLALFLGCTVFAIAAERPAGHAITIGVVFDGPGQPHNTFLAQVKQVIQELNGDEFSISLPEEFCFTADWSPAGVDAALSRLMNDERVDVVLAFGILASDRAARLQQPSKPVIAPFIIDPALQGLPVKGGASGVHNFTYVSAFSGIAHDISEFAGMVKFKTLGMVVQDSTIQSIPSFNEKVDAIAHERGITIRILPAGTKAADVLDALSPDIQAVYVGNLFRYPDAEMKSLADGLSSRGLPSMTIGGAKEVALGFMSSLSAETDYPRLARRIALNLQRILLGEDAGNLPVAFTQSPQLTINMATCRTIGFYPTRQYLSEADVLNAEPDTAGRRYDLAGAMRAAVAANPQVEMAQHTLNAGEQDVVIARSGFYPKLDIGSTASMIDADRARAAMGANPERQLTAKGTFQQLIWSEQANANLDIQNLLQETRSADLEKTRLDIALDAGVAYLNVLRAKAAENIYRDHLRLTRSNLELARVREAVGSGGRIDVYRWESQLATAKNNLNNAQRDRTLAQIQLNRILNRPLEEPFATEVQGADVATLLPREKEIIALTDNPHTYALFRDFLVKTGYERSPELRGLDAAIAARTRALESAHSAYWSPTVALQATVEQRLLEGGDGTQGLKEFLGSFAQALQADIPDKPDSTNWSLGVNATFSLYDGEGKSARVNKAAEELATLKAQRALVMEQIAQAIRSTAQSAGTAYTSIALAHQAADAAHKGLDLVADAYSRGVVNILDLLDAQSNALTADQLAINTVYNFAIELLRTERASGRIVAFMDDAEWRQWMEDLTTYLKNAGSVAGN